MTSESPLLDPEKTEVSQTLDTNLVANLPVATRNWSDFVLLTPNVVQDGSSGLVSFHGISGLYNQNYVDGANNNQILFSEARGRASGAPYVYSVDSIKEFQAQASNYSVEFGQAAGGQVNAITKSGTNSFHGDLFYSLRYPSLNALDPLTKFNALHNQSNPVVAGFLLTQPVHQQHQFGGSVGGPIIRDRLFYFFTYDGFRKVGKALYTNSNTISLTPSGNARAARRTITPTQCPATIYRHAVQLGDPVPAERKSDRPRRRGSRRRICSSRGWTSTSTARTTRSSTSTLPTSTRAMATAERRRFQIARRAQTAQRFTTSASWWAA